ncbi:biotin-dependent carboxyltransferase family protein [Granulosicoccus sp.]|nr:biotin-dependent carboxyltransferase family protein [Granulosicoccus sp.]MDB4223983.1 biotin-dependent carboxyltransferase family protein [Granulosicoccus sp.]
MPSTRFKVIFAGPLVSFQDGGRPGHMRYGVPSSGPMDRLAHTTANIAVGNTSTPTAIEVSMGGIVLECLAGTTTIAVVGGGFQVECGPIKTESGTVLTVSAGQKLSIRAGRWGSWCYLAFAGTATVDQWLGKTATHSQSGFGGGLLRSGQEFDVEDAIVAEDREGDIPPFSSTIDSEQVRVVRGPQDQHFSKEAMERLFNSEFSLTSSYDRMGVRLDGPTLNMDSSLSIPSEPILKGSIQVAGDGVPTVLLADHQTTGGYPKIATMISSDMHKFVQLRTGDTIRFKEIEPEDAIILARSIAIELESYYAFVAKSKGTLGQRLMQQNLISGVLNAQKYE